MSNSSPIRAQVAAKLFARPDAAIRKRPPRPAKVAARPLPKLITIGQAARVFIVLFVGFSITPQLQPEGASAVAQATMK